MDTSKEKLVIVATYGTLKSGGRLCYPEHIICKSKDYVNGVLYNVSGTMFPFPGIDCNRDGRVEVEVQVIRESYLKYMRYAEGSMYREVEVITEGGVPVIMFECLLEYDDAQIIKDGVWIN